jgi:hypothetical protein
MDVGDHQLLEALIRVAGELSVHVQAILND